MNDQLVEREADTASSSSPTADANGDRETDDLISRNIRLTGDLLHQIFDDLTILERIPNGATVYVVPEDDPALAASNLEGAHRAKAAGQTVYLHYLAYPHGLPPS